MQLLLTEIAAARFGEQVHAVAPELSLLRMRLDGTLIDDAGAVVPRDDATPDLAWMTADVWDEGGQVRQLMGAVRYSRSIQWFQSSAAGTDAPVFAEIVGRGVRLTTAHVNNVSIAEYVMRAALDHFQEADRWRAAQAAATWELHTFREVQGSTWLIVGLGAIGAAVATRARAFGATVVGVRRTPRPDDPVDRSVALGDVADELANADVVLLSVPATPATTGLADEAFFAAMRPGSLLVNVGRGALVDEDALRAALDRGAPARAALDVVNTEPLPPDSWMWTHPGVVLTPHNAASGNGRLVRAAELFCENLRRYLAGEPLLHEVTAPDLGA